MNRPRIGLWQVVFVVVMVGLCISLYRDLSRDPLLGGRRPTLRRTG